MKKKKDLLVTLADKRFINQAKQLFSSVYFNAGWQGDYMLLAHEIPEKDLSWFRKKGILIKKCRPLQKKPIGKLNHPSTVLDKFYLFTTEFKKWGHVVYLDADIIVRGSLNELAKIKGFAAPNATGINFKEEFINKDKKLYDELKRKYPMKGSPFNTGIFALNTSIIKEDTFKQIMALYKKYGKLNRIGEESTLNLLFYKKWELLPIIYNMYPIYMRWRYMIKEKDLNSIIVHFVATKKPWRKTSHFYKEWLTDLKNAESINLSKRPNAKKIWTKADVENYFKYLKKRRIIFFLPLLARYFWLKIDKNIGRFGLLIKCISPNFYEKIKIKK